MCVPICFVIVIFLHVLIIVFCWGGGVVWCGVGHFGKSPKQVGVDLNCGGFWCSSTLVDSLSFLRSQSLSHSLCLSPLSLSLSLSVFLSQTLTLILQRYIQKNKERESAICICILYVCFVCIHVCMYLRCTLIGTPQCPMINMASLYDLRASQALGGVRAEDKADPIPQPKTS